MRGRLQSLLVIRLLLVTNGVILAAVGTLFLIYGARPAGYVVGGILAAVAIGLWSLVPLTDPYRSEGRRR